MLTTAAPQPPETPRADAWLDQSLPQTPEARRGLLRGLRALRDGDPDAATTELRRARRQLDDPGLAAVAASALAECALLQGREGAARRLWRGVARDTALPSGLRRAAWWRLLDLAQARGNTRAADTIRAALDGLAPYPGL